MNYAKEFQARANIMKPFHGTFRAQVHFDKDKMDHLFSLLGFKRLILLRIIS